MKCLVTGGAGFIGSYVVDLLIEDGYEVVVIDDLSGGFEKNINKKAHFYKISLEDMDSKLIKDVEVVYHLAAHAAEGLSVFMPYYNAKKNYMAFMKLVTACVENDVKTFVFTSSMAVYGDSHKVPFDEKYLPNPCDPYGVAKASIERLLQIYSKEFGLNYVILRLHNVYGIKQNIRDPYRNVIGIFINRLLHGKSPIIYGDGTQKRAFSHISDIVPYIVQSAFTKAYYGEVINLGGSIPRTINEVARVVLDEFGSILEPIYVPPRPCDVKDAYCTVEKSKRLLCFSERADFREETRNTIEWAKKLKIDEFSYYDKNKYEIKKRMPKTWTEEQI